MGWAEPQKLQGRAAEGSALGSRRGCRPGEELHVILRAQMVGGKRRAASLPAKCILASARLLTRLLWPESRLVARKWAWWQCARLRALACIGIRLFRSVASYTFYVPPFLLHQFSHLQNRGAARTYLLDWTRGHGGPSATGQVLTLLQGKM